MFKRKANTAEEPETTNEVVQPIPRHIPSQSVTLNFTMRTWEEIAPGKLYYLPLCQNPKYMMDKCMLNQFNQFANLWATMEIHQPKVRMSNFIMLQDDLRVQNNTPTDATAFTQVVYMLHYKPKAHQMYFALQNLGDDDFYTGSNLVYELEPKLPNVSRLVEVENFDNFERLLVKTADPGITAGFQPYSDININTANGQIKDKYIPPTYQPAGDDDVNRLCRIAANLQPEITDTVNDNTFIPNGSQLLFSRNQDKIEFVKYGDTIEFDIVTNLDNKQLLANKMNDFTETVQFALKDKGGKCREYLTEWCWPGPNRPYYSRSSNLDGRTLPVIMNKALKPLQHHFFCMPPIKKPNGALLGQRCSMVMEQHFAVTFNFSTAVWPTEEEEEIDTSESKFLLAQKEAINVRRNIYGVPGSESPLAPSPFCGPGKTPTDCGGPCPEDTWDGFVNFFATKITDSQFRELYRNSDNANLYPDANVTRISAEYFRTEYWLTDPSTQAGWLKCIESADNYMCIDVSEPQTRTINGVKYILWGQMGNDTNVHFFRQDYVEGVESQHYLYINASIYLALRGNMMSCTTVAPAPSNNCYCEKNKDAGVTTHKKKRARMEAEQQYANETFNKKTILFFS